MATVVCLCQGGTMKISGIFKSDPWPEPRVVHPEIGLPTLFPEQSFFEGSCYVIALGCDMVRALAARGLLSSTSFGEDRLSSRHNATPPCMISSYPTYTFPLHML